MDIIGIGYLGFESTQLDEWRSYGPEVLGFQIGRSPEADAESLYFRIDDRRHRFAFHPGKVDRLAYIGWEARGKLEFEAAARRLRSGHRDHDGRRSPARTAGRARRVPLSRSDRIPA
jgi:hypothetical protein